MSVTQQFNEAIANNDGPKLAQILQATNIDQETKDKGLFRASRKNKIHLIPTLLNAGANPNYKNGVCLHEAAHAGYTDTCHLLLKAGAKISSENHLALVYSTTNGKKETTKLLLSYYSLEDLKELEGSNCQEAQNELQRRRVRAANKATKAEPELEI